MTARRRSNPDARKLTKRQFIAALWRIAVTVYHAAPTAIIVQLVGTLVTAILPIVTTYFAAMTTSALAAAYAGEAAAGARAVEYVIITAVLGVMMTAWRSLENYLSQMMRYRIEVAMSDTLFDHSSISIFGGMTTRIRRICMKKRVNSCNFSHICLSGCRVLSRRACR